MSVADALAEVRTQIDEAARASGREPSSVKLVAVSKTKPPEAIREAYAAGQRAFGESYAQELDGKAKALADLTDIEWHFIGHLQSNKAKVVTRVASLVHTVDGAALARELGRRAASAGRVLPVLVEVNVASEPQKYGASPQEIADVIGAVQSQPSLALRGLMTMPPSGDLEVARRVFSALASLRSLHGGAAVLPELSMGMSQDFAIGIACGATIVRVGTAVFGQRG